MKILLIEDDELLARALAKGLKKCHYAVDIAVDGEEALLSIKLNPYDLIILDLNLPKRDGIDVLKTIRLSDDEIKIIILSARSEIEDRVAGLDYGANDYLIKPFDFNELHARIRNLLRRSFNQLPTLLTIPPLELNLSTKTVSIEGTVLPLTKKEYSILEYLMSHKNTVISQQKLLNHVWESDVELFTSSLKYHLHSLKKKLITHGVDENFLKNVRGHGYIIEEKTDVN